MARLRYNALKTGAAGSGVALALGASLTNSATPITFNAALTYNNGTAVPTITGSDYIPLEIQDASGNMLEIVWLTAYTSGATTGTIARGKEGTTGVAHSSGEKIVHGPTVIDVPGGFTQLRKSAGQTISGSVWTALTWDTEDYDDAGMHDNTTNNTRITAPFAGVLQVAAHVGYSTSAGGQQYLTYYLNGVQQMGWVVAAGATPFALSLVREIRVAAGDYVEAYVYTTAGSMSVYKDMSANIAGSILTARMVNA